MKKLVILCVSLIFILSCKKAKENKINDRFENDSISVTKSETETDYDEDCVRSKPEKIMDSVFTSTFQLVGNIGIETFDLPSGENVKIKNWGCEYYVLTFIIQTSEFDVDTTDFDFWYRTLVNYLSQISVHQDAPIQMKTGYRRIIKYIDSYTTNPKKLNVELVYDDSEIASTVVFEHIRKIYEKTELQVTFSVGPL